MKPVRTLILMASEARLRLAENAGVGKGVYEILTRDTADFGDLPSGYSDVTGRGQSAPGAAGHGLERPTSEREQARDGFAAKVVEVTLSQWQRGGYDRFILVAPPKMLGVLRKELPTQLGKALSADMDKDLTKLPETELAGHLESILAV